MPQADSPEIFAPILEAYFHAHHEQLVNEIQASLVAQIDFYRQQPVNDVRQNIQAALVPYFAALEQHDPTPVLQWLTATLSPTVIQHMPLDFLLHSASIYRAAMFDLGLQALHAGVPDAAEGLRQLSRLIDNAMRRMSQMYQEQITLFRTLADYAPDGISVTNADGAITYANPAFRTLMGYGPELIGMRVMDLMDDDAKARLPEIHQARIRDGVWRGKLSYQRKDGSHFTGDLASFVLHNPGSEFLTNVAILRDMTGQMQMDEERQQLQEQVIQAQRAALAELSTPIIPISDRVMVMPLIGSIDSARAQQIIERLLEGVIESHADSAIIDITGVPVVDTHVAQALLRTAQAASLIGARVVLTGIRPEVAQTLIGLGVDMTDIVTRSTLQSGIAYALGRTA